MTSLPQVVLVPLSDFVEGLGPVPPDPCGSSPSSRTQSDEAEAVNNNLFVADDDVAAPRSLAPGASGPSMPMPMPRRNSPPSSNWRPPAGVVLPQPAAAALAASR